MSISEKIGDVVRRKQKEQRISREDEDEDRDASYDYNEY